MGERHGIGVVGLGVISERYLTTLKDVPRVRIVAAADLVLSRAEAVADRFDGCRALSVEELLADPEVDTVLNLTIPAAHAEIALAALRSGKNVYGEKPFAATVAEGREILAAAGSAWVGGAPDTVLGTGVQTARAAVDDGMIGRPLSAMATWISPGHEAWHPNPDFYYLDGGGPLYDMGPYYLTTLVHLLGPVVAVRGAASRPRDTRRIASGPRAGELIPVEVATHVTGVLEHEGGALSSLVLSFDGAATVAAPIEVHGETGTLSVPDPNTFEGAVLLRRAGDADWTPLRPSAGYVGAERGVGLLDCIDGGLRASGELSLHVLEIMESLLKSGEVGERIPLHTTAELPSLVPLTEQDRWRNP
ncbi:MAG TPA: Gfo/Idh/MocA family oxidoreductase [Arachnia sp.]|nr:Gfo/Idh/MocA family oxidoreductase [Arachnia sp.]